MPVSTMTSAFWRMSVSSTSQPNLFQVLKPMGGTGARIGSGAAAGAVAAAAGSFPAVPGPQAAKIAATRMIAMAAGAIFLRIVVIVIGRSLRTGTPDYRTAGYSSQQEGVRLTLPLGAPIIKS